MGESQSPPGLEAVSGGHRPDRRFQTASGKLPRPRGLVPGLLPRRLRDLLGESFRRLDGLIRRPRRAFPPATANRNEASLPDLPFNRRRHDFTACSDGDLRDTLSKLSRAGSHDGGDETLAKVFAVVDEAISRRLGAWRLFAPDVDPGALRRCRELAGRVLSSAPYKSRVGYYTDEAFLESPSFHLSLQPLVAEMALDPQERCVVETMVYVAEKSKAEYWSNILLPAEFYSSLWARDTQNALRFRVTAEQLEAGFFLYRGNIVEMNAGEGKTVAAAFPAVLHAVLGRRVHIITANDYLASRDTEWLAPVYESLGLSVGTVLSHMSDAERREAYTADIVYGTLREFGFDYMRDNLKYTQDGLVQGPLDVAIVDEADQALIDEARTPLIIASNSGGDGRTVLKIRSVVEDLIARQGETVRDLEKQARANGITTGERRRVLARLLIADPENAYLLRQITGDARLFRRLLGVDDAESIGDPDESPAGGLYYVIDTGSETVSLTDRGQEVLEAELGPLFDDSDLEHQIAEVESDPELPLAARRRATDRLGRRLSRRHNRMNQAFQMLRAYVLLRRDVDYIVADGRVVLVDELTGRTRPDTRYQFGLQAALEAKERVRVQPESRVLAQISVQGLMRQYGRIAGMTGTALASQEEFRRAYRLDVVAVPPSNPERRTDFPSRVHASRQDKLEAVVDQVKLCQQVGRPALVGTLTVEQSDEICTLLDRDGVEYRRLDAVNSSEEAEVVRAAGSFGAVTVATNMAGRGTDILLEPGLDRRIAERCVAIVRKALSGGAGAVAVLCASVEEAQVLESALAASAGLSATIQQGDGSTEVLVTSVTAAEGRQEIVTMEIGLGLYVIGTEMNESRRIDLQLRGRGGRQGHFGSSRFILSFEDRTLAFSNLGRWIPSRDLRCGQSGPAYYQGKRTQRLLDKTQAAVELDDEVRRGIGRDFHQAIESQTKAYHRFRREVLESDSFHGACLGFVRERARRLVSTRFPPSMMNSYATLFDGFAEELWVDYRVDVQGLWELGIDALKEELARLMAAKLEKTRAGHCAQDFDKIEKLLFLKTGDELRIEHLAGLQDLMLGARLAGLGHKTAVAEFMFNCIEEERKFRDQVVDTFLPRLVTFEKQQVFASAGSEVNIVEDVQEILV